MKNIDKSTCWYNKNSLDEMVNAVKNHPNFEDIGHGKVIINLLKDIDNEDSKLLDLSCGGGHLSTIVKGDYTGSDMNSVIENVSKICYPDNKYIYLDLIEDKDLSIIKLFDIVILNAIIDILESPLEILNKILKNCSKYVVIHRQEISNMYLPNEFILTKEPSYGGITFRTNIEKESFNKILKNNKFSIIKEMDSGLGLSNNKSFLLKKNDR